MAPRYTVLLPTHNRRDVLPYAIRSVLNQSEPDFELFVVGDGCTDGTDQVVASFRDSRIRWFDLPKAPSFGYANRNLALLEATGELVAFMAHDDLLLPDHLELLGAACARPEVEWAYSRPLWVADDGRVVPFAVDLRDLRQLEAFLTRGNMIPASCVVYRRSCHERYGTWPEESAGAGDWDLWKRIIGPWRGANAEYLPIGTALHFRAHWRTEATWGPDPLSAWLDLAATNAWPASLKPAVPEGSSPQAALWAQIERDGPGLSASLRDGVTAAIDLLSTTMSARLQEAQRELSVATERLADVEQQRAQLQAWLAEARASADLADAQSIQAQSRAREAEARAARITSQWLTRMIQRAARRLFVAVRGNPLFDAHWYSARYGDAAPGDAARHWKTIGVAQLRDPNQSFSTSSYLERYSDVRVSGLDPLDHYYVYGSLEGRSARHQT